MKKITLLVAMVAIMFTGNVNAQENTTTSQEVKLDVIKNNSTSDNGVYLKFNIGYNLSMGSQVLGYNSNETYIYDGSESESFGSEEAVYGSLGKGFNLDAAIGYKFNKHVGMEFALSYLIGGKIQSSSFYKEEYYGDISERSSDYTTSANMFRINPSLIIEAGSEGINPYAKFGFIIGMGKITNESIRSRYNGSITNTEVRTSKYNGGVSFGANAAVGAYYPINDKISLFGELTFVSMSYSPKKGEITSYTENGRDILSDLSTSEKETDFVKEYSYDSNDRNDESKPSEELIYKLPFGSFGFNFGVKIGL